MKVTIFYWGDPKLKDITGYEHNQVIDYDKVFDVSKEIFEKGLNVMLINNKLKDTDIVGILFIDDRNFKQR